MDASKKLKFGKLPDDELSRILEKYTNSADERVLLGPKLGEDAAIIDMGSRINNCLAVCVDPILVNISNAPYFAVAINVNDIVTRGAIPKWASASVFFPEGSTLDDVDRFFGQLYDAIKPHGISIVTGHTEVTSNVKNPGVVLTMLGEVDKDKIITTAGAKVGDSLVLTGGAGIEGTAIISEDLSVEFWDDPRACAEAWSVYSRSLNKEFSEVNKSIGYNTLKHIIERAKKFIHDPGICVAEAAYIAWKHSPNSLHDPTEGGIRKGIEELAFASGNGVYIDHDKIPILSETKTLCSITGDDPLAIFGSGALLISIGKDKVKDLLTDYQKAGIVAQEIGRVASKDEGRILLYQGKEIPLQASYTDGLIDRLN